MFAVPQCMTTFKLDSPRFKQRCCQLAKQFRNNIDSPSGVCVFFSFCHFFHLPIHYSLVSHYIFLQIVNSVCFFLIINFFCNKAIPLNFRPDYRRPRMVYSRRYRPTKYHKYSMGFRILANSSL